MELDTSSIEKRFAFGFLQQLLRWMDISQEFIAHLGTKNSLPVPALAAVSSRDPVHAFLSPPPRPPHLVFEPDIALGIENRTMNKIKIPVLWQLTFPRRIYSHGGFRQLTLEMMGSLRVLESD